MKDEDIELISGVLGLMTNTPVTSLNSLLNHEKFKLKVGSDRLGMAIAFLKEDKLIEEIPKTTTYPIRYQLTAEGGRVKNLPGGYREFIEQKSVKEQTRLEKEQRDEELRNKQLQDHENRLNVFDAQFKKQMEFWQSGIKRDSRQKWQFWITLAISVLALAIALLNAFKLI